MRPGSISTQAKHICRSQTALSQGATAPCDIAEESAPDRSPPAAGGGSASFRCGVPRR